MYFYPWLCCWCGNLQNNHKGLNPQNGNSPLLFQLKKFHRTAIKENNARKLKEIEENESAEKAGNNFSKQVIGFGIFASGAGIAILGGMADNGQKLIITTGVVFALFGLLMTRNSKPKSTTY